jgi:replicative DNA helicase
VSKYDGSMQHIKTAFDLEKLVSSYQKQLREEAAVYLQKRGIAEETVTEYQIGFDTDKIGFLVNQDPLGDYFSNRIIIPLKDTSGKPVDLIGRAIDHREPKYKSLFGIDDLLFNQQILEETEDVVLCNGVFDVLTLSQEKIPAVCLPTKLNLFKDYHAQLLKDKRLFICLGNDDSGHRESTRIAGVLSEHVQEVYIVNLPENIRDINDLFVRTQNPMDLFMGLLNKSIEDSLLEPVAPDFRHIVIFNEEYSKRYRGQANPISTGLNHLDEALYGGLVNGLYLLTGPSSCGKSMLLKQMADDIAYHQTPVIYFSWDHSHFECWARSIARILSVAPYKVLRGLVPPEQIQLANQTYVEFSKMLWTIECSYQTTMESMVASVEQVLGIVDRTPVICIDHLQRVPSNDQTAGTKYEMHPGITYALKQLSTEWNTPIIASAQTSDEMTIPVGVEASADVIWQLQRDPVQRKQSSLQFLKHRHGVLSRINLTFEPEKALFSETE